MPWWDILFVLVPTIAVAATGFYATDVEPADLWTCWVGVALAVAVPVVWFAFARQHRAPTRAAYIALAIITVLVAAGTTIVPVLGILQGVLYPYLWTVLDNVRRSVIASAVIAGSIVVTSVLFQGPGSIVVAAFAQVMSFILSVGIGLAIGAAWNVADERQTLLDELTVAQEQVRELSRQSGISAERERLSRELHDTLAQTLAGLSLLAERSARNARKASAATASGATDEAIIGQLDQIAELAKHALAETRALIAESAPVHAGSGTPFDEAIERLAERFRRETGITVEVGIEIGASAIPRDHQVVLLRSLQEALANVRRHAHASRAAVRFETDVDARGTSRVKHDDPRFVSLTIADDGKGFSPDASPGTGFGIPGLRERARLLDGSVLIDSVPGDGSQIRIVLPLPDDGSEADADDDDAPRRSTEPDPMRTERTNG